jgi:hypothetical protein
VDLNDIGLLSGDAEVTGIFFWSKVDSTLDAFCWQTSNITPVV